MKDGPGLVKSVLAALAILIVAVFVFVAYSSYSSRQKPSSDAVVQDEAPDRETSAFGRTKASAGVAATPQSNGSEVTEGGANSSAGMVPPAADSIQPDPANGMKFGGAGHYQLYRQGNLTWRLNTDTGQTCIIFATEEEWRKPQVYRSGCRGK